MSSGKYDLSDNEGTLLSLVLRIQPTTSYQIIKIYSDSPVSNFNTSKGKIYPLINRLEQAGLIAKKRVDTDRRGTEQLSCTAAGKKAVKEWILKIRAEHLLLDDPLRTKVQSFNDFIVFGSMVIGSFASGGLLTAYGWSAVCLVTLPPLLFATLSLAWARSQALRAAV